MDVFIFLLKFVGATLVLFAILCGGLWSFARISTDALTLKQAAVRIAATHLGRLKFLFLAGVVCFVLMVIYPGPPLLISEQSVESLRKAWHGFSGGGGYVPRPPERTGTWFWGQAALLYFGILVLYLVLGIPDVLSAALQAGKTAWTRRPEGPRSGPATGRVLWDVACAFVAALVVQLVMRKRGAR
jgi:hypothetical protein